MTIRMIGNDIEIDGQKVARILDVNSTTQQRLYEYIENANGYAEVIKAVNELQSELVLFEYSAEKAYNDGRSDGFAEGKLDGDG